MYQLKDHFLFYLLIGLFFIAAIILNVCLTNGEQQFSYLAESFLSGKTYFVTLPRNLTDTVYLDNNYYWPLGPFPAVLLTPFVYIANKFGFFFQQGYLQIFLTFEVFYVAYKLAKQKNFSKKDALLLAFAFCFASPYQLIAFSTWSWFFAQALCTLLIFAAIYEYLYGKKKFLLIGCYMACAFATRFTSIFGILFFILFELAKHKESIKLKLKKIILIILPMLIVYLLLCWYNFQRFGNVVETGYLLENSRLSQEQRIHGYKYGLLQLENIPTNLYYYFVKPPEPFIRENVSYFGMTYTLKPPFIKVSFPGVSFFWVAPIFLYCFRASFRNKEVKFAIITSSVVLFVLLSYYWPGWRQVGARYFLDFLPFLYLVLLHSFPENKLSHFTKTFIIASAFFDFYLLTTILGV